MSWKLFLEVEKQVKAAVTAELGHSLGVCVPAELEGEALARHYSAYAHWLERADYHRERIGRQLPAYAAWAGV